MDAMQKNNKKKKNHRHCWAAKFKPLKNQILTDLGLPINNFIWPTAGLIKQAGGDQDGPQLSGEYKISEAVVWSKLDLYGWSLARDKSHFSWFSFWGIPFFFFFFEFALSVQFQPDVGNMLSAAPLLPPNYCSTYSTSISACLLQQFSCAKILIAFVRQLQLQMAAEKRWKSGRMWPQLTRSMRHRNRKASTLFKYA